MPTTVHMGAIEFPAPPHVNAPETAWGAYWALCHSLVYKVPEPEGYRYRTHIIKERDGKYYADIEYDYGDPTHAPSLPAVVIPGAVLTEEETSEQYADAMHARGELTTPDETSTADIVREPVAGETASVPTEVLPPEKPKRSRAKKKDPASTVPRAATVPASLTSPLPELSPEGVDAAVADIRQAEAEREAKKVVKDAIAKAATQMEPIQHAERRHHRYSMSKLNYIDECPGFKSREGSSDAADEGTALHEVVEAVLQAWLEYNSTEPVLITLVQALHLALENGLTLPSGVKMEDGQIDAVRDVLKEIDWQIPGAIEVYIEERLPLVHPDGTELNYGHIDLVIGHVDGKCTVIDYKFGRGQVRDASRNYQGFGYAMSFLQAHPEYDQAKIVFVQPRISFKSEHVLLRTDIPGIYHRINLLIENAERPDKQLRAGDQCRYCAMAPVCAELANYVSRIAASYENLPMPTTFHGTQITDPTDMALALFWAKRAEPAIDGIKKAAVEMARQGLDLTSDLGPLGRVSFELGERASKREVGKAPLVYKLIKDIVSPEEFTACVDIKIGDLEKVYADAYQARLLATTGEKITKKAAVEHLGALLGSEGLVTRSDERIFFLKERKAETAPQLENVTT